jgi:hypothetical protein
MELGVADASSIKFAECIRDIAEQDYPGALQTVHGALSAALQSKTPPKAKDIAGQLLAIVVALEQNLKKAYGAEWNKDIPKTPKAEKLACSFCGKEEKEVGKLIAGPSVYICDECIDLCNKIIAEESKLDKKK